MAYEVNYDDKRFAEVEGDKKEALNEVESTYGGMIENADSYYNAQINASKKWAEKQTELQNEQTDFAIEKIEQNKEQAKKDYTKEQSGAYVDWQKQSNQYGANAEQMAASGLTGTGFSESSQVSMYNQYQARVTAAREAYQRAVLNYDNAITEARLQNNSALAEIAYKALQDQLELSLQGFQYKNTLILEKTNAKRTVENDYYTRWQNVLNQINHENAMAEEIRQYNESLAENRRQYNESLAFQKEQFAWQKEQANKKASSGGSGGSSGIKKTSSGGSRKYTKSSSDGIKKVATGSEKSSSSSSPKVDMASVLTLGYGPISAAKLNSLISQGLVTEYEEDGKLKYKRSSIARKGGGYLR